MLAKFFNPLSTDIAIDLGTANTLVYCRGRGIVVNEPSVVAVSQRNGRPQVLAVGHEANRMLGRTPDWIHAIRPVRSGVIADFDVAQEMMRHFIARATSRRRLAHPRVIVSVPSGATPVERRAVREAAESAGARQVFLIEEALAAAVGAGLPVSEASGSMIVDIGGGTTEIAVLALSGIVQSRSLPIGGFVMDEAISSSVRRTHNLLIGEVTAELVKRKVGAAIANRAQPMTMEIKGRDMLNGVPRRLVIDEGQASDSLSDALITIIDSIKLTLESTPPELAADIADKGIVLTGGGALLRHLDLLLRHATGLPVIVAEDPLTCAVRGAGFVLDNAKRFPTILQT